MPALGFAPRCPQHGDGGPENQSSCPPGIPQGDLEFGERSGGPEDDAASGFEPMDFENCLRVSEPAWQ